MKRIQEHVKRVGYQVACATSAKSASVTDDPWALRRVKVKGSDKLGDFKRKVLITMFLPLKSVP